MNSKKELRTMMMKKRSTLTEAEIRTRSEEILNHLKKLEAFQQGEELLCFITMASEPDTSFILQFYREHGKKTAAPKVLGDVMEFFYFDEQNELRYTEGAKYKILEPTETSKCTPDKNTVVIMPGLVFDTSGHRIGYGGGYYDKYLSQHPNVIKIAIAFDFQVMEQIPSDIIEETDIIPDYIVTDKKIYKIVSNGGTNERN